MKVISAEVFHPACEPGSPVVGLNAIVDQDLTPLLPYIKGEIHKARYDPKGGYVRLKIDGHPITVDHEKVMVGDFGDDQEARAFLDRIVDQIADIEARKDSITPDSTPYVAPNMVSVLKLLPRKPGCKECGYPACMAFATALTREEAELEACTPLSELPDGQERLDQLREMLGL